MTRLTTESRPRSPVRPTAVAGTFYPGDPAAVAEAVRTLVPATRGERATAVVCPHAGWWYSGPLAGKLLGATAVPARVVILCPNHTGAGPRASIWPLGRWAVPGGAVDIDERFCHLLLHAAEPLLEPDDEAHADEHAIEVLLPMLRARRPAGDLSIAPIVLGGLSFAECDTLGHALAQTIRSAGADTLIVASSDMSHYLSDAEARALDPKAIAPMEALDPEGLYRTVRGEAITMCGYIPATVAMVAARELGASRGTLVGYTTSAEASGDTGRVVGYAAVAFR